MSIEELRDIFPKGRTVLFGGEKLEVKTFPIDDIDILADMFESVFEKLKEMRTESKGKAKVTIKADKVVSIIVSSMKENKEPVYKLIKSSTGFKEDDIPRLSFEAVVFLLKHIVQENMDFFESRVLPMIKALMEKMNEAGDKVQKTQTGES